MTGSPLDIDALDLAGLRALVLQLLEKQASLRAENAALREENGRLKGLKGPPDIKPSGMDKKASSRAKAKAGRKANKTRRGAKKGRVSIDERRVIEAQAPAGSRFKGYEDYLVQDLVCRSHTVLLRRERWLTASGETLVAPLPAGTRGHFGAALRRFVLALYHRGQTTVERLTALLGDLGVAISKRQVVRLLNDGQEAFLAEAEAVLRAGLAAAPWVSVDDTGARHANRNGVTTQIGNDAFTCFATTFTKTRLDFLRLLRAGEPGYALNDAAFCYMRGRQLAGKVIARLEGGGLDGGGEDGGERQFADAPAWQAHLKHLGIAALKVHPDPVKIATEGALWGAIVARGMLTAPGRARRGVLGGDRVILSDGAGQFKLGYHALCWVHAERLIHKLDAFNQGQRREKERIRTRVWWLYADLKAYRENPSPRRRAVLRRRFDAIFTTKTGFGALDRLLTRIHANKAELLVVLDRPEVPLNTNQSENDIRAIVTRRKISGGTRSEAGKQSRDTFLGLIKTCQKLGISTWDYLGDRLKVPGANKVPPLPELVTLKSRAMA